MNNELKIGANVIATPKDGDFAEEFNGLITGIDRGYWVVTDGDGDCFMCEDSQLTLVEDDEPCRYCEGNCPNDEDNACDGYLGDVDELYADEDDE
jgi:hypothetical protein